MTLREDEFKVEYRSESGCSNAPGFIKVWVNGRLRFSAVVCVESEFGADMGLYPCAKIIVEDK